MNIGHQERDRNQNKLGPKPEQDRRLSNGRGWRYTESGNTKVRSWQIVLRIPDYLIPWLLSLQNSSDSGSPITSLIMFIF